MSGVRHNPSPGKLAFAREMRAKPTVFEKRLKLRLKKGIRDIRFTDQVVMCGYILDFYCHELKLAIELDGNSHNTHKDKNRDSYLFAQREITVLRFPNPKSEDAINELLFEVWAECKWRMERLNQGFSTFPNRSSKSSQQANGEACGLGPFVNICANVQKPGACNRQVFSSEEVARTTAISLLSLGIDSHVERCPTCNLIHLAEQRVTQ